MPVSADDPGLLAAVRALLSKNESLSKMRREHFDILVAKAARLAVERMAGKPGRGDRDGDGYGYVRKFYGVSPKVGQRVSLPCGRLGTVVPVHSGLDHHVHFVIDGYEYVSVEHPNALSYLDERVDATSCARLLSILADRIVPEPEFEPSMISDEVIALEYGLVDA